MTGPKWRTLNLMPGNVIVACNLCDRQVRGDTAVETLNAIKRHLARHVAHRFESIEYDRQDFERRMP